MSATAQTGRQLGVAQPSLPPWYSPSLSAPSGSDVLGDSSHQSHIGLQSGVIPCAYISHSCPLIGVNLNACFGGGLPVMMPGDLNAKHLDWKSRVNTRRGKILRYYAEEKSCLIFGPDYSTTNPYNHLVTLDVLDIAITNNF